MTLTKQKSEARKSKYQRGGEDKLGKPSKITKSVSGPLATTGSSSKGDKSSVRKSNSAPLNGTNNLPNGIFLLDQICKILMTFEEIRLPKRATSFVVSNSTGAASIPTESKTNSSASSTSSSISTVSTQEPSKKSSKKSDVVPTQSELKMTKKMLKEIKALIDKGDQQTVQVLLSERSQNISVFQKCISILKDPELNHLICSIIMPLMKSKSQVQVLIQRKLSSTIFECLKQTWEKKDHPLMEATTTMLLQIILRLGKFDSKVPLFSRLHGIVPMAINYLQDWHLSGNGTLFVLGVQCMSLFSHIENNALLIMKSALPDLLIQYAMEHTQFRGVFVYEYCLDLLIGLSSRGLAKKRIIETYGFEQWMELFLSSRGKLSVQKRVLKIIKNLIEIDEGKRAFVDSSCCVTLFKATKGILESSCIMGRQGGESAELNSFFNLLISILQHSFMDSNLAFLELNENSQRSFSLTPFLSPSPPPVVPSTTYTEDATCIPYSPVNVAQNDYTPFHAVSIPTLTVEAEEERKLSEFFPESKALKELRYLPVPKTISVVPFVLDISSSIEQRGSTEIETEFERPPDLPAKVIFSQVSRIVNPEDIENKVVYDVYRPEVAIPFQNQLNILQFESRFESGNLQKAIRISELEYDLLLQTGINEPEIGRHNQWYFFSVSRMKKGIPYRFNIINMSKPNGLYNYGMQPCMYSMADKIGWRRAGANIYYYKNNFKKPNDPNNSTFATLTFEVTFSHDNDTCYFAYHYPYTYSDLQRYLNAIKKNSNIDSLLRHQVLCKTLSGNNSDLLTITQFDDGIQDKKYVFLSARVHPGESNSSYIMKGVINTLISDTELAKELRKKYIFKIIPMLNPDGVINGGHRCSLAGRDLNRQWKEPNRHLYPTIYWAKKIVQQIITLGQTPMMCCDFHGHSRRKNLFVFGCEKPLEAPVLNMVQLSGIEKLFPKLLGLRLPDSFDTNGCTYSIEKSKEGTARVVWWREFNISCSYTLESSYCGADKKYQFSIQHLEKIGNAFAETVYQYGEVLASKPATMAFSLNSPSLVTVPPPLLKQNSSSSIQSSLSQTSNSNTSSINRKVLQDLDNVEDSS